MRVVSGLIQGIIIGYFVTFTFQGKYNLESKHTLAQLYQQIVFSQKTTLKSYSEPVCNWSTSLINRCTAMTVHIVDLVIFACLDFREFVLLRHSAMSRIRALSILMIGSAIIIIIFARFLNSRIFRPREIREN